MLGKIYLHACIGINPKITNHNLFLHFLDYYNQQGIDNYDFVLQSDQKISKTIKLYSDIIAEKCKNFNIKLWQGKFCTFQKHELLNSYIDQLNPDDWLVICDVDEFHRFKEGLSIKNFLQSIETEAFDVVSSILVDRTTTDGSQVKINYPKALSEQFPVCADITKLIQSYEVNDKLVEPYLRKIIAIRHNTKVTPGHHNTINIAEPYPEVFKTDHYKWDNLVKERIKDRIKLFEADKNKYYWIGEYYSAIEHLEKETISKLVTGTKEVA